MVRISKTVSKKRNALADAAGKLADQMEGEQGKAMKQPRVKKVTKSVTSKPGRKISPPKSRSTRIKDLSEGGKLFQDNLKYFREKAGLSQRELASRLGLSNSSSIYQLEKGIRTSNVRPKTVARIAEVLGILPSLLFTPVGTSPELIAESAEGKTTRKVTSPKTVAARSTSVRAARGTSFPVSLPTSTLPVSGKTVASRAAIEREKNVLKMAVEGEGKMLMVEADPSDTTSVNAAFDLSKMAVLDFHGVWHASLEDSFPGIIIESLRSADGCMRRVIFRGTADLGFSVFPKVVPMGGKKKAISA